MAEPSTDASEAAFLLVGLIHLACNWHYPKALKQIELIHLVREQREPEAGRADA